MKTNMIFRSFAIDNNIKNGWGLSILIAMMLLVNATFAQTNQLETDKGMQNSVAAYDADVRQAILLASQHPQTLSTLQQTKNQTQASFRALINDFSEKKQGWFYELTRFPDLTHTLATMPEGKSREAIQQLLPSNGDENLEKAAWRLYRFHKEDLQQADALNQQAQDVFAKAIQPLDTPTQEAFNKLAKYPDIMVLLTDNLDLTTKLGQQYTADQEGVKTTLAALHDSLMVQNQAQLAAYKKELESNPQAKQELNQAAKDFARSNGYILPNGQVAYGNNYNYGYANPYSYWFGYPSWYGSPLWYPSAYWGSFGLSYGYGGFGFSAFPYLGFSNWFYNGGYYLNYPYLNHRFGNYYRTAMVNRPMMGYRDNGYNGVVRNQNNAFGNGNYNRGNTYRQSNSYGGFQNRGGFSGGGGRSFGGGGSRGGGRR